MVAYKLNKQNQIKLSFIVALGGYLFGFDFAVISGALPFLRKAFLLSSVAEGFLTGSLALGCIIGSIVAGRIADYYGRKPGLVVAALVFAVSSLGMAIAPALWFLVLFRFCAGIGVGMASILSPLYISEISDANVRGRNIAINQLTIVLGIFITNFINFLLARIGQDAWRYMFGMGAIPAIAFFAGLLKLPESPRWTKARMEQQHDDKKTNFKSLFQKKWRLVLFVGITLAVFQQFCGINIVFNYTSTIFAAIGANVNEQLIETIAIGFVNLIFTLIAMRQVDKWGRRPLMLFGSLALGVLYLFLSFALKHHWSQLWVSLFVLLSIAGYAISLAPITWVLIAEIFPGEIRGQATSTAIAFLWGAYFLLVFTFPIRARQLGTYGPFYFYAIICIAGFFFILKYINETKCKPLEDIE
jgi:MFS family permease